MQRFRVMVKGAPVFLLDVDSQKVGRLGFYTTRWVRAESPQEAERLACRIVLDEFTRTGAKNPPDQPIMIRADEVTEVSWFEMVRRGPGQGFTFYPDEAS